MFKMFTMTGFPGGGAPENNAPARFLTFGKSFCHSSAAKINIFRHFLMCVPEKYNRVTSVRCAFTLAEVLITLGIIGIVAAMTLPALIQSNANRVVETRLAKFYSSINQAVMMAEVTYGDKKEWYQDKQKIVYDEEGNLVKGASEVEIWWNRYIAPNMRTVQVKYDKDGKPIFFFADGSGLMALQTDYMRDWIFFTGDPDRCVKKYGSLSNAYGKCAFVFLYYPLSTTNTDFIYHKGRGFEPYKFAWDGKSESLYSGVDKYSYTGCNIKASYYCAALIQSNGWKIPKDYPFRVSY